MKGSTLKRAGRKEKCEAVRDAAALLGPDPLTGLQQYIEEHVVSSERVISRVGIIRRDDSIYPLDAIQTVDGPSGRARADSGLRVRRDPYIDGTSWPRRKKLHPRPGGMAPPDTRRWMRVARVTLAPWLHQ